MRVLVCGSRHYDPEKVEAWLNENIVYYTGSTRTVELVIEGGARGADCGGRLWGETNRIPVQTFPADWDTYGKRAGPIRNSQMLKEGKPDLVIAFLFHVGVQEVLYGFSDTQYNRGTKNMIDQARKAGVETVVVNI